MKKIGFLFATLLGLVLGSASAWATGCSSATDGNITIGGNTFACSLDKNGNTVLTSAIGQPSATGTVWNSGTAGSTTQAVPGGSGAAAMQITFDQTSTITGGAITIQGSYDNTNWLTVPAAQIFIPNQYGTGVLNPYMLVASTNQPFIVSMGGFQSLRLLLSTAITGSGSVTPFFTALSSLPPLQYTGITSGCMGQPPANTGVAQINIASSSGATLINGVSGLKTYICQINLITATAQNVALIEGTGTVCGTSTAGMAGGATAATGWNFAANGGIALGDGRAMVAKTITAADNICLLPSGAGQISGNVTYAQFQ